MDINDFSFCGLRCRTVRSSRTRFDKLLHELRILASIGMILPEGLLGGRSGAARELHGFLRFVLASQLISEGVP
jgi:hypothetical protein